MKKILIIALCLLCFQAKSQSFSGFEVGEIIDFLKKKKEQNNKFEYEVHQKENKNTSQINVYINKVLFFVYAIDNNICTIDIAVTYNKDMEKSVLNGLEDAIQVDENTWIQWNESDFSRSLKVTRTLRDDGVTLWKSNLLKYEITK
ncbi:MAG: hypothetical protein LBK94_00090 [Prevotellaceae bacterium]|nr:hypothetical protein [Prevotellaceae bacterium]